MKSFRRERVSSLIKERFGLLLERSVEVPGALITVTDVRVSSRLERAEVLVSVYPSDKSDFALAELRRRAGEFQFQLLRDINIRPMPRLSFSIDRGPERAARIEKALLDGHTGDNRMAP
jgi:ribosome-binding factor A